MKLHYKKNSKRVIFFAIIFIVIFFYLRTVKPNTISIAVGGIPMKVEVASTEEGRQRGLSGHEPLGESEGMLFVFEESAKHGFWMKDMNFAIDILWFDQACYLVGRKTGVTPETFPTVFYPEKDALFVLETKAFFSDNFDIKTGRAGDFCNIYTK